MSRNIGLEISGLLGHPVLSQLVIVIGYREAMLNVVYSDEE